MAASRVGGKYRSPLIALGETEVEAITAVSVVAGCDSGEVGRCAVAERAVPRGRWLNREPARHGGGGCGAGAEWTASTDKDAYIEKRWVTQEKCRQIGCVKADCIGPKFGVL